MNSGLTAHACKGKKASAIVPAGASLNGTTDNKNQTIQGATGETTRQSDQGVQAAAPQMLTDMAEPSLFQTPTLSYGEVGTTHEVKTDGVPYEAPGVGEFRDNKLLERMTLISTVNWTASSSGQLFEDDMLNALASYTRNANILSQFQYMRAGIECTVRMNTSQFYYGALGCSMYPTNGTGGRLDERMVMDPTILSANSATAVIKRWKYSYPHAFMKIHDGQSIATDQYPVYLSLDVLAPLTVASATAAETVSVQIWARFTDVVLAFPIGIGQLKMKAGPKWEDRKPHRHPRSEVQASIGPVKIKIPKRGRDSSPGDSSGLAGAIVSALSQVAAPDDKMPSGGLISSLLGPIEDVASFFLDKPDCTDKQMCTIQDGMRDQFLSDIEDSNTCLSLYKQRYVDPGLGRMPLSKTMTVSDYARIPGLRDANGGVSPVTFSALNQSQTYVLIQTHVDGTTDKIPLDWAYLNSMMWRGSIKVTLMFFTSMFISTRVVVEFINNNDVAGIPTDYTAGLSRVIDIKGDTVDSFTLPWLDSNWWSRRAEPQITVTVISDIVSTDISVSPKIYMICWVAGGEDIQFAYPRIPADAEWGATAPGKNDEDDEDEVQCSVGALFETTFPPIGEGVQFQADNGLCNAEQLGAITDICKRYSPMVATTVSGAHAPQNGVQSGALDYSTSLSTDLGSQAYSNYWYFRHTYFGMWRSAFLFRSGGVRYRCADNAVFGHAWTVSQGSIAGSNDRVNGGDYYLTPNDRFTRITVPQVSIYPFSFLGKTDLEYDFGLLNVVPNVALNLSQSTEFIAARDDLQLGFPILPPEITPCAIGTRIKKEEKVPTRHVARLSGRRQHSKE